MDDGNVFFSVAVDQGAKYGPTTGVPDDNHRQQGAQRDFDQWMHDIHATRRRTGPLLECGAAGHEKKPIAGGICPTPQLPSPTTKVFVDTTKRFVVASIP